MLVAAPAAMAAHIIEGYDPGPSKTGRLCAGANEGMVVIGDADFGSVPAAYLLAKQGKGCILNVKNAHKFFPKEFLETHLAGCGAGSQEDILLNLPAELEV